MKRSDLAVFYDAGTNLERIMRSSEYPPELRTRILAAASAALAKLHNAGLHHGRPNLRDLCWDGHKIAFLDFEYYRRSKLLPDPQAVDLIIFFLNLYSITLSETDQTLAAVQAYRRHDDQDVWGRTQRVLRRLKWISWITAPVRRRRHPHAKEFKAIPLLLKSFRVSIGLLFVLPYLATNPDVASAEDTLGFGYYGQINQGLLTYDDGVEKFDYGRVDNASDDKPNHLGLTYSSMINGTRATGVFEFELAPKRSDAVSQLDQNNSSWRFDENSLRKLEVVFETQNHGTFFIGQGNMAMQGFGPDLSGTSAIMTAAPAFLAGGNFWRRNNGGSLATVRVSDTFQTLDNGRRLRARYDSPASSRGFSWASSIGREVLTSGDDTTYVDLVGRYERNFRRFDVAARVGVNTVTDGEVALRTVFSILYRPWGLSATVASGHDENSGHYGYVKAAWAFNIFSFGNTTIAFDHYNGGNFVRSFSEGLSEGWGIVQRIDRADLEVFLTSRYYVGYSNRDIPDLEFRRSEATMFGLRWTF